MSVHTIAMQLAGVFWLLAPLKQFWYTKGTVNWESLGETDIACKTTKMSLVVMFPMDECTVSQMSEDDMSLQQHACNCETVKYQVLLNIV